MKYTRWICGSCQENVAKSLVEAGYPRLVSALLSARGIQTAKEAAASIGLGTKVFHDPLLMKDMEKAVDRLKTGIETGEKIAVFGDYDVDGITSTVLLVDYLRSCGANCTKYIPRRIEDGYGLGKEPMRHLAEEGVTLIVTVDCGITAREEAEYAKELGIDLIITDHHECQEELPDAVAVVNPHRPDCSYPFPCLAGVGVAFKLVLAMGGQEQFSRLFETYATLAAIGTVADVMKMTDENRTIVLKGLAAIRNTRFLGLKALLKETGLWEKEITSTQIGFVLAPRINAAGRMGEAELAADLLLTNDPARAEELARELCALNKERQTVEQEIFADAVEQIDTLPEEEKNALVLYSDTWHQGVVGIVASRLAEKYSCPSFMIHLSDEYGKCSCRSYGGFNLFTALEQCSDLLEEFGGHELAAGFTIHRDNIADFRARINRCVREFCNGEKPVSSLELDLLIEHGELLTLYEVESLAMLEPFGAGNNRPSFLMSGMTVEYMQCVGQNRHLKLRLSKGKQFFDAIYFSAAAEAEQLSLGQRVDVAFHLQINEFRNNKTVQLQVLDLRPSLSESVKERECLRLLDCLLSGDPLRPRDAAEMLPTREQFVRLWQSLMGIYKAEGAFTAQRLPLMRGLSRKTGGSEPFLRTLVAMEVFQERGLLWMEELPEGELTVTLTPTGGQKVSLEDCPYMQQLRSLEKGGM